MTRDERELTRSAPGLSLGANGGDGAQVRLNGAPAQSSADLGEIVQMVWLTPAMDRLFIESASGRRRFLDRLVLGFDAGTCAAATRYETAMRERARLLKYGPRDPGWLDGLENEMAEAGIAIAAARAEHGRAAQSRAGRARRGRRFPCAQLALAGETDTLARRRSGDAVGGIARTRSPRARMRDAEAGRTTFGPHVTDLAVRHTGKAHGCARLLHRRAEGAADLHRAGRCARTCAGSATAVRRSCCWTKSPPIWIAQRRAALFEEILALGAQAWMTGTDLSLFEASDARSRYLRWSRDWRHSTRDFRSDR